MIHVFFVPGMFGSTIEYILRSYGNELTPIDGKILANGSMHSFTKSAHFRNIEHISDFFESNKVVEVTTPIYPFKQQHLHEILEHFNKYNIVNDSFILIYAGDTTAAELNMLFQYHKIPSGLDVFFNNHEHNITAWSPDYTHWSQMHTWQLREWISLFYVQWCQEWIESPKCVDSRFLTVKNTDFLFDAVATSNKIFDYCKLTQKSGLDDFLLTWQKAQQYIVDEFNLLDQIVNCVIAKRPLNWQPISIIAEAIVQQRLRAKGYEIRCDGLDKFPTDAIMLNSLLEKIESKQMRKLYYMGLESYEARYTLQLTEWNRRVFDRKGLDVVYVPGTTIDNSQAISVGQVLDAHGRSYFSMSQMMNLVQLMKNGEVTNEDVIYFEDMFQPGIESLPYILNQVPADQRPRVYVRCLAQSIDPDDFVHVWGMAKWMGLYEQMVNEFVDGVLATNEEMVAHMRIAGWRAPIYNISGLAFGKEEVLERIGGAENIRPFDQRPRRVGFAARFDQEKQPDFFMDLIEMYSKLTSEPCEFAIYSGGPLRSNNPEYIERARRMEQEGKLKIYENLSKNDYYALLNDTRVLFNCALQDWVSNTVSEADTLGANVVFPAYRSFPETFANDPERLYVPWSIDDAYHKMQNMLHKPHHNMGLISDWNNGTIDRVIDIMQGQGEQWNRAGNRYRDHVAHEKYQVVKIEE